MPPPVFVPMNAFAPDGGDFGPELALVRNYLPVYGSWNSFQKKQAVASVADGPMTGAYVHIYQQTTQVQKARPDADTTLGTWLAETGAELFSRVNETTPADASFIYAPGAPSSQAVKLRLSDVTDPVSAADHFLRWRYRIPVTPSSNWTVTAQLVEGTTVRATDTATGAALTAWVERTYTLTAGEANSITDYTNLFVVFTATAPGAAQFGRPASDSAVGGWLTQVGGSTNLYAGIDESVASDADYIESPALSAGGAMVTYAATLSSTADPLTNSGYTFRWRYQALNAGVTIKVRLKQGSTVVREDVVTSAATSWTTQTTALSTTEAALITDHAGLTFEAEASYPASVASASTQSAAPIADTDSGAWTPSGSATLFGAVDETVASDGDFIQSPSGEFTGDVEYPCTLQLGPLADPLDHSGHVLRIRAGGVPAGLTLRVELLEGAGVIKSQELTLGAYATTAITLTAGEAALIGDYTNLFVRLTKLPLGVLAVSEVTWLRFEAPAPRRARISWMELQAPSAVRAEVSWAEVEVPGVAQSYKGDIPTIFSSSKTKIYEVTTGGFTDRSKGGGYGAGAVPGAGRFCSFGNDVIFTNRADPVQYRAGNTGAFADLITSTRKPKARFCAPVRNHLVLADINLTNYFPDQVWWSALDDARTFVDQADAGANPATQSDQQRIVSTNGQIMGLVGGDYGVILKRNSMHLMGWTGGNGVFRFDDITAAVGTPYPSSVVQTPYGIFFFDGATFRRYAGGTGDASVADVGTGILSQFLADAGFGTSAIAQIEPQDIATEDQIMLGHWDPFARVVIWIYQATPFFQDDQGIIPLAYRHMRGVVYNPQEDRWGTIFDQNLLASVMACKPNVTNSDTHLLKGTVGFDWNGTTTSWFQFNGANTYSGLFQSKRQALGIEGVEPERSPVAARLMGVLPVFSHLSSGSAPPAISVSVTASNDPWFYTDARVKTTDTSRASAQGILPCDITASWFLFSVTIPELTAQQARAFRGLYCFWAPAGQPGVTG